MTSTEKNSMHVLVCGGIHADGLALLDQAPGVGHEVIEDTSEMLAKHLPDADGVIMRICDMDAGLLDDAPRLRVVSRHGVGCDNIPVDELTKRKIPVMVTGDANSDAVAEHTLYMLFALKRRGIAMDKAVRQGDWKARARLHTTQVAGKIALVIGCGRIGRLVVGKLKALGMRVVVFDPFVDQDACESLGADKVDDLHNALSAADVVTLHLPSAGDVVIGEKELAVMQAHAVLINVSRGDLVDEKALVSALTEGKIAGAGTDVFSVEPPPTDHPLLSLDNVVLTPHSAALTEDSLRAMGMICAQNVLDVFAGAPKKDCLFNPGILAD